MTKTVLLATALALVGCSKKSESGGGGDPCGTAINSAVDKMIASRGSAAPAAMTDIANKLRGLMTDHCRADKWPAAVIDCFAQASDQPSIKKCRQQLPPELAQKLQTDIIKVMSAGAREGLRDRMPHGGGMGGGSGGGMGGGEPVGSAAAEPAGSAAGSAAAPAGH